MPYLDLHDTLGGDSVDPAVALANNWDQVDSKFKLMDSGASPVGTGVVNPEAGMEFVGSGLATPDISTWDTSYKAISTAEIWGSYTAITLATNFSAGTRTPRIRVSNQGRVQLRGSVVYKTGVEAWPAALTTINSVTQLAAATYAPAFNVIKMLSAGPITGTTSTSWAYAQCVVNTTGGFLQIALKYMGAIAASGNYVDLGGLNWFVG